ncbi:MAG: nucleotidyltransferase domain-containing protein [Oscillospiraceae bacterium]|nr:nucleotidyltransferase domain-containing protein [Oscillospiraceae bacterium]
MLDKTRVTEIAKRYSEEVKKIISPVSVVLFGSYVNGVPNEWSDIDVAVLVENIKDEDWHDTCTLLHRIIRNNDFINIEPHLLDLNYDPSGFVEHVLKTGEIVYQSA